MEGVDLMAGMEGEEVGEVTVAGFRFFVVFDPFLEAAGAGADGEWREFLEGVLELGLELKVIGISEAEEGDGFDAIGEEVMDDLEIHGGAIGKHGSGAVGFAKAVFG